MTDTPLLDFVELLPSRGDKLNPPLRACPEHSEVEDLGGCLSLENLS